MRVYVSVCHVPGSPPPRGGAAAVFLVAAQRVSQRVSESLENRSPSPPPGPYLPSDQHRGGGVWCHRDDGGGFVGGWGERRTGELWRVALRPPWEATGTVGQLPLKPLFPATAPTSAQQRVRVEGQRGRDLGPGPNPRVQSPSFLPLEPQASPSPPRLSGGSCKLGGHQERHTRG